MVESDEPQQFFLDETSLVDPRRQSGSLQIYWESSSESGSDLDLGYDFHWKDAVESDQLASERAARLASEIGWESNGKGKKDRKKRKRNRPGNVKPK
jgi:hypothetical protein